MKKLFKYIISFLIVGLAACSDYLDIVPDNVATVELAFHDKYNAKRFLYTCYSYLPNHGSNANNPALNSGDEIWFNEWVNPNGNLIAEGQQNIINPYLNFWNGERGGKSLYKGIRDCNIFIDNIDKVLELTEMEVNQWKAEVRFLKAYYHWYLIQMYGPVILVKENQPVSITTEEMLAARSPIDECFQYVVDEMEAAATDLPDFINNVSTELGRITRPIALATKARIMVNYASPLFNGNPDYKTLVNKDGQKIFNNEYDDLKWVKAAEACSTAIEACHNAGHRLYLKSDYISNVEISDTTLLNVILRQAISERWNPELIWGNSSSTVAGLQNNAIPKFFTTTGGFAINQNYAPTLRIAEMFYSDKGVPIEEDVTWDYENRFELRMIPDEQRLFMEPGQQTVNLHFHREPRFYSSLAFDRGAWYGNGRVENDLNPWYIHARYAETASLTEKSNYSITGYWPKKLVHIESEQTTEGGFNRVNYPFPIMRMADLYLLYAEALNEANGPTEETYKWIDMVRERAGIQGVVDAWELYSSNPTKPATKEGLRNIIHQERLIELAFEGSRYWDLRRWKRAAEFMNNKPIRGWDSFSSTAEGFYNITTLFIQEYVTRDYLWPFKERELTYNTSLVQNPGW